MARTTASRRRLPAAARRGGSLGEGPCGSVGGLDSYAGGLKEWVTR